MASSTEIAHTPDLMEDVKRNDIAQIGGMQAIGNGDTITVIPAKSTKGQQPFVESEGDKPSGNHGGLSSTSGRNLQSSLDDARLVEWYHVLVGLRADAYRLLQLPAYCDDEKKIKTAWLSIIQQLHSDHNKVEDADEYGGAVNAARDKIKTLDQRKRYDEQIKEEKKRRFDNKDLTHYETIYVPRDATDEEVKQAYNMELAYFPDPEDQLYRGMLLDSYFDISTTESRAEYNRKKGIVPTERAQFFKNAIGDESEYSDSEDEAEVTTPPPPSSTVQRLLEANTGLVVQFLLGHAAPDDLEAINKKIRKNNIKKTINPQAYIFDGEDIKAWRKQLQSTENYIGKGRSETADTMARTFLETFKIRSNEIGLPKAWSAEVARQVLLEVHPQYLEKQRAEPHVNSPPVARDDQGDVPMPDARLQYPDLTQVFGQQTDDEILDRVAHRMGQIKIVNNPETKGGSLPPGEIPGGCRILGYYPLSLYACTFITTSSNPRNPIRSQPGSTLSAEIKDAFFRLPEKDKTNVKVQVPNAPVIEVIGHCLSAKAERSPPITCPSYGFVLCRMDNNQCLLCSQSRFLGLLGHSEGMQMIVDFYAANKLPLPWHEATVPPNTTLRQLGETYLLERGYVDPDRRPENYGMQKLHRGWKRHLLGYEGMLSGDSEEGIPQQRTYPPSVSKPHGTKKRHGLGQW
ncbi:hypothetical protein PG999_005598 [Apiospora kogelbergensis]|uniref:J domain-containing protein n=1 Tax=Apiospora kogelbergensis TaxID=1337665 RepID=A0AAW0R2P8_9PEZI